MVRYNSDKDIVCFLSPAVNPGYISELGSVVFAQRGHDVLDLSLITQHYTII